MNELRIPTQADREARIAALEEVAIAAREFFAFYDDEEGDRPWFDRLRGALQKLDEPAAALASRQRSS